MKAEAIHRQTRQQSSKPTIEEAARVGLVKNRINGSSNPTLQENAWATREIKIYLPGQAAGGFGEDVTTKVRFAKPPSEGGESHILRGESFYASDSVNAPTRSDQRRGGKAHRDNQGKIRKTTIRRPTFQEEIFLYK